MLDKQPCADVRQPRTNYAFETPHVERGPLRLDAAPWTEQEKGRLIVARWGDCNDEGQIFVALGAMCVIAGGCVAAASSVAPSETASWAAAYLVLVAGVAQVFLGLGQVLVARPIVSLAVCGAELACWNVGNTAVLVGVVGRFEALLLIGSALLVVALGLFAFSTRRSVVDRGWLQIGYRIGLVVLTLSIPAGVVLARSP
jgi:hypothetical protein